MANLLLHKTSKGIACVAVALAFLVVILGAFTRLSDAGLGCPDWPGCYGQLTVPDTTQTIQQADKLYPNQPVEPAKAWAEMVHRYAAGTLGVLIMLLALFALINRRDANQPVAVPIILVGLLIFQAALGMWTVTLQLLPVVVMGHLLGGMTILSLLWLTKLQLKQTLTLPDISMVKSYRFWAMLGLIIVAIQIALGGWTSSNYAALACPDFPYCQGQLLPFHELAKAFNVFMPVGANFQGGVLDGAERVSIHVMHRLGGLITGIYLLGLCLTILVAARARLLKRIAAVVLLFLLLQITLGILNVVWHLPLPIAVMHNGVAALLLLSVITLNYVLYAKPTTQI